MCNIGKYIQNGAGLEYHQYNFNKNGVLTYDCHFKILNNRK